MDSNNSRTLKRMAGQGIVTVKQLINRLPNLSRRQKSLAIWLVGVLEIRAAANVLFTMLADEKVRDHCASVLSSLGPESKLAPKFLKIGQRELSSASPDSSWLSTVIQGVGYPSTRAAATMLVAIFERRDLPGWLRGDAADKLGGEEFVCDHRTGLHRRCRDAALHGLTEGSIDVQFWSIFVLASMGNSCRGRNHSTSSIRIALPILRNIAETDHRLAPGFWWTMSAEATDAIGCIENGVWPNPDAADRAIENRQLGPLTPR